MEFKSTGLPEQINVHIYVYMCLYVLEAVFVAKYTTYTDACLLDGGTRHLGLPPSPLPPPLSAATHKRSDSPTFLLFSLPASFLFQKSKMSLDRRSKKARINLLSAFLPHSKTEKEEIYCHRHVPLRPSDRSSARGGPSCGREESNINSFCF